MKDRCNPDSSDEKKRRYYSGRGISICEEWRQDFPAFREWALGHGYRDDLTLDRIDSVLGYSAENCRWIPEAAQHRNVRSNRYETAFGETKCLAAWVVDRRCVVKYSTLRFRLDSGWSLERALQHPARPRAKSVALAGRK